MVRKSLLYIVAILCISGTFTNQSHGQQVPQRGLATMALEVVSKSGRHQFSVELATTYQQQAIGMMGRTKLDPDKGMFFVYGQAERRSYWMKGCLIYLDIIYIRENGRIANIIRNAAPGDENPRHSRGPVLAVLELAGGRAQELGIRPGDQVVHSIFKAAKSK